MPADYKLIIFDWDGTLMDSAQHIVSNMLHAIDALGLPKREPQAISELIGLGLQDAFSRLFPDLDTQKTIALLSQYRQRYGQVPQDSSLLFDGVHETLDQLRGAGYSLAVATGKSRAGLDRALLGSGIADYFCMTRCADESADKPHPQMLFDILHTTDHAHHAALMVGDTEYDMHMAQNAKVHGLAVECGVHAPVRLQDAGARAVLPSVADLPAWLGL
jgi:phosphoglycolate phosphatase